jgi:hypothetical protein
MIYELQEAQRHAETDVYATTDVRALAPAVVNLCLEAKKARDTSDALGRMRETKTTWKSMITLLSSELKRLGCGCELQSIDRPMRGGKRVPRYRLVKESLFATLEQFADATWLRMRAHHVRHNVPREAPEMLARPEQKLKRQRRV